MKQIVENSSNQFLQLEKIINQQSQKNLRLVYQKKNSIYNPKGVYSESKNNLHILLKDNGQIGIDTNDIININNN